MAHGKPVFPDVNASQVKQYMHHEMLDYHCQIYAPKFKKNKDNLRVTLPEFSAGGSNIELVLHVKEDGFIGGNINKYGTKTHKYLYSLPGDNQSFWGATNQSNVFLLSTYNHLIGAIERVQYSYYPQGKENGPEIKGEKSFGLFD